MGEIRNKITGVFAKLVVERPEFIQTGSIRRSTRAGGGPSDPSGSTVTNADTSARMAVFEIAERRIDGTNIFAGDFQIIVEPLGIEVTLADKVICDRGELTIAKLGREASGGETLLYDMVCRG
jgi:hypothetical protein